METQRVSSSNIASIGYDESTSTLEVRFLNGGIYHYFNVPLSAYRGLMTASSHGTYLNAYIKGVYRYRKVN